MPAVFAIAEAFPNGYLIHLLMVLMALQRQETLV